MNINTILSLLYDVGVNAAAYSLVDMTGITDKLIKPEGDFQTAINLGLGFTVSQEIAGAFLKGHKPVWQGGDWMRFIDTMAYNSIAAQAIPMLGISDLITDQTRNLGFLTPTLQQRLIPGAVMTTASVGRLLLDSMSATQPALQNLTHPVYAAQGLLTFKQNDIGGGQAKTDQLLLF